MAVRLRLIHDFHGRNEQELVLRKGDIVYGRETIGGWWRATDDAGNPGLVPVSYCQPLEQVTERQAAAYGSGGSSFVPRVQWPTPTMMSVLVVCESSDSTEFFVSAKRRPIWAALEPHESFSVAAERALQASGLYAVQLRGILRIEQRFRKYAPAQSDVDAADPVEPTLRPEISTAYAGLGGQVASVRVVFWAHLDTPQPSRGEWLSRDALEAAATQQRGSPTKGSTPADAPTLAKLHEWACYLSSGGSVMTDTVFTPPRAPVGLYESKLKATHLDTIAALRERIDALLSSSKRAWMMQQLSDAKEDMETRLSDRIVRAEKLAAKFDTLDHERRESTAAARRSAAAVLRSEAVIAELRNEVRAANAKTAAEAARTREQFVAFKELAGKQAAYIAELEARAAQTVAAAEARCAEVEARAEYSAAEARSEHIEAMHSEVAKLHALHLAHAGPAVVVAGTATLVTGAGATPATCAPQIRTASAASAPPPMSGDAMPPMPGAPPLLPAMGAAEDDSAPTSVAGAGPQSERTTSGATTLPPLVAMPRHTHGSAEATVHASGTLVFAKRGERDAFMDAIEKRKEWNTQFLSWFTYAPPVEAARTASSTSGGGAKGGAKGGGM